MFDFTITADSFLRHMVRTLVGTMLEAGLGQDESPPVPRPAIREAGAHG